MTWANDYVGIPFKPLGRTREGADCWGLVRLVQKEVFDRDLPDLAYDDVADAEANEALAKRTAKALRLTWWEVGKMRDPIPGDILMLKVGGFAGHVGVVIDSERFLHCWRGGNATIERYKAPQWKHRIESVWGHSTNAGATVVYETMQEEKQRHRPARVVARLHPFRPDITEWHVRPGTSVVRAIRGLKIPGWLKEANVITILNGTPIPPSEWGRHRIFDGDLLNVRVVPANKQMAQTGGTMALGAGALALAWFLSRSGEEKNEEGAATQNNNIAPPIDPLPTPPPEPVPGVGGYKDLIRPRIAGISNQKNNFGAYFLVCGEHKEYPFVIADPFVVPQGGEDWLNVILCGGYGEMEIDTSTIKIGQDTLLDDLVTAGLAQYQLRLGTGADAALTLYPYDVHVKDIGEELEYNVWMEKTAGQEADQLAVDVIAPDGLYGTDSEGERVVATLGVRVEYRLAGSGGAWTLAGIIAHTDNTTQAIRQGLTWSPGARGVYEVRCRNQAAPADGYVLNVNWLVLRSIIFEAPINTVRDINGAAVPMVLMALKIKASETTQGTISTLSWTAKRKVATYNGSTWGTPVVTSNPAWICADILCGVAFNRQLDISLLDADAFKDWADYCDEKGLEFNFIYDTSVTIQQALDQVCSAGRASFTARDGKLSIVVDNEKDTIVQMFTPANTWDFSGEIIYPVVPHALRVLFVNPDLDWQQDTRLVLDDGYSQTSAKQWEELQTIGITSASQAYKAGRYQLAVARLRRERFSVSVDQQHLVCVRGDRVRMAYDLSYHALNSGVITAVTENGGGDQVSITVDNYFTIDSTAVSYGLQVRLSDGTFLTRQITSTVGDLETLTWSVAIPAATSPKPAVGDLVTFGYLNQEAVDMLIESIEYNADMSARITLVDYAPSVFDSDTGTIPAYNPQISTQMITANTPLPAPVVDSCRSDEAVLRREGDGSLTSGIQITLAPSNDPRVFQVQYQFKRSSAATFFPLQVGAPNQALFITGVEDGTAYDIWIRYLDIESKTSAWTKILNHTVVGKTTPPPDVPELLRQNETIYWRYDSTVDVTIPLDFAGFRVKFHFGQNTIWSNANLVEDLIAATSITLDRFPGGIITILVKAVDVAGNESTNARALILNLGDFVADNVWVTVDEHTTFTGTKTGCAVDAGELKANDTGGIFWSGNDSQPFWSGVDSNNMWDTAYGEMQYEWSYTPDYTILEPFTVALDYAITGESYTIEYRTLGNSLFYETNAGADSNVYWTDDSALYWQDDPPWAPWTGEIAGSNQKYEFRATVAASTVLQGKISELSTIVDVPDIEESISDAVIDSAGTRLAITQTYRVIEIVNLTVQQDASYPDAVTVEVIDKDITGPLIRAFDSTHTPVSAKVDAIVQGY